MSLDTRRVGAYRHVTSQLVPARSLAQSQCSSLAPTVLPQTFHAATLLYYLLGGTLRLLEGRQQTLVVLTPLLEDLLQLLHHAW
jgi:hypothetical protein